METPSVNSTQTRRSEPGAKRRRKEEKEEEHGGGGGEGGEGRREEEEEERGGQGKRRRNGEEEEQERGLCKPRVYRVRSLGLGTNAGKLVLLTWFNPCYLGYCKQRQHHIVFIHKCFSINWRSKTLLATGYKYMNNAATYVWFIICQSKSSCSHLLSVPYL